MRDLGKDKRHFPQSEGGRGKQDRGWVSCSGDYRHRPHLWGGASVTESFLEARHAATCLNCGPSMLTTVL